ncbi:hypothetical protein FO519_004863 [Halicephalobus sp. NKZ332]|nr:hypothetical protein FO519_004863 [Halicephalobus sp. NKZ332]
MRIAGIFLFSLIPLCQSFFYLFQRPVFDCRRIHPAHCCASRIRAACPQLCHRVPCNRGFGGPPQPPRIPQPSRPPATPAPFAFTPFPPPLVPPQRKFGTEGAISPSTSPFGSLGIPNPAGTPPPNPPNPYPTLMPEGIFTTPAISSFIEEKSINIGEKPFIGSNGAVDGEIRAGELPKKGKKKGVLTPPSIPGFAPDELVELVDYEEEVRSGGISPEPTPAPPVQQPHNFWTPSTFSVQRIASLPEGSELVPSEEVGLIPQTSGAIPNQGIASFSQIPGPIPNQGFGSIPQNPGAIPNQEIASFSQIPGPIPNQEIGAIPQTSGAIPNQGIASFSETPGPIPNQGIASFPQAPGAVSGQEIRPFPGPPGAVPVQRPRSFPETPEVPEVPEIPEIDTGEETVAPVREASGSGIGNWRFVVKPSGYKGPDLGPVEVQPSEIIQEHKAKADKIVAIVSETDESGSNQGLKPQSQTNSIFTDKVGEIIGAFFSNKTILPPGSVRSGIPPQPSRFLPESVTIKPVRTTMPEVPVLIQTVTESPPCGVAPDFTPCVSSLEASKKLLDCCKKRLMPPGCLELCRYDVTQAEIKKAFDAGKCGILNVAPFLECASDGNNNLECCHHRGVSQKSGPQCEVFCNPVGGLGSLGLQHIVCQSVIGDLLQCHHSGIRR